MEDAPASPGVYILRNLPSLNGILFIKGTSNIKNELLDHWLSNDIPGVVWFDWYQTESESAAKELEKVWLQKYTPEYNV